MASFVICCDNMLAPQTFISTTISRGWEAAYRLTEEPLFQFYFIQRCYQCQGDIWDGLEVQRWNGDAVFFSVSYMLFAFF